MKEAQVILNRLLDKFENSKHLSEPNTSRRRVMLRIDKRELPEYQYEDASLQCSMMKRIEYDGQETPVTMYWNVSQALVEGTYQVSIFADGNMIGSRSFAFK